MLLPKKITRRAVLRGTLGGIGISLGLPLLDCWLNGNGTALANGSPIPVRFGTWFWGLGMNRTVWTPTKLGADYDLPPQIESWKDIKKHVNILSNYNVVTDGRPALCHYSGWVGIRTGVAPAGRGNLTDPTLDVLVADAFGGATRFPTINCAANGKEANSFRSGDALNVPESSPLAMYANIFGAEFQDPNAPEFTPRPSIMVRHSVLSGLTEQRTSLMKQVGAADRARLDQYFTSLRSLEKGLEVMMQKPAPAPTCKVPGAPKEPRIGTDVTLVMERHNLMTDMLVMALACNQTRIFNLAYSEAGSTVTKQGEDRNHHIVTHEEVPGPKGYQEIASYFVCRAMESFAYFVKALSNTPEGPGSLLDNSIVFAHSDQELAQTHEMKGIPMMTAGSGGGRFKTGFHIDGKGGVPTQVVLTIMKSLGMSIEDWGKGSMKTSNTISELLA